MMSQKRWTFIFISCILTILLIIFTINYVVDPYGVYHYSSNNYNHNKSTTSDPYLVKAYKSKKLKPEAIVLGTSRALRLDPSLIESLTGQSTYNLGLSASSPYINLKYLEYVIKVDKNLKTVFLGLDFETFNKDYKPNDSFNEERLTSRFYTKDLFLTLLSKQVLEDSYKVLSDNLNQTRHYTQRRFLDNGSFDETSAPIDKQITLSTVTSNLSSELSDDGFNYIKTIKQLCEQHDIKLYIYITPVHAILLETYWQHDQWHLYNSWIRQLVDITPIWDFSGYHDISMSSIDEGNYHDLSHFSKKTGNLILYRMLNQELHQVPDYFGVLLTSDNIEDHIAQSLDNRQQWSDRDKNLFEVIDWY